VREDLSEPREIAAARSKYLAKTADAAALTGRQTEAQLSQRGPRMPIPPHRRYNGGAYPTHWMANSDPGHALIGAGIGFAIGATIGAVGAVNNRRPVAGNVLLGGSLFALFGWAIGASHGPGHPFMRRRRTYPVRHEDAEECDLRSPAMQKNSQAMLARSVKPALPREPGYTEASTASSHEIPPLP
jgi:hypothetical protein